MRQLDPSHAELVVSDRGPGIPLHERRLVFERFYRSTTARALPGSGLGLAIVKQVVLNHGGLLRVEDTVPGGQPPGTSIYVLLPGRPMPMGTYSSAPGTEAMENFKTSKTSKVQPKTDPAANLAGSGANSRDTTNVISVDSQSARAR
jgi:two-component system, OmpR family, sensor histidine kinase MprB